MIVLPCHNEADGRQTVYFCRSWLLKQLVKWKTLIQLAATSQEPLKPSAVRLS